MKKIIWLTSILAIFMIVGTATALPEILDVFNIKYDTFRTILDKCDTCHIQSEQKNSLLLYNLLVINKNVRIQKLLQQDNTTLNPYGKDLKKNLNLGIRKALSVIEGLDSDKDKISNINEINNLTSPGDKQNFPDKLKPLIRRKNPFTQVKNVINYSTIKNYQPP